MAIHRLNHAVLYVRNVERSVAFYREVLGFALIEGMQSLHGAAFLRAPDSTNDHDLGLFEIGEQAAASAAGRATAARSTSTSWCWPRWVGCAAPEALAWGSPELSQPG